MIDSDADLSRQGTRTIMRMWLSKPLYEAIPYFYFFAGVSALLASIYLNYWFWPVICLIVGFTCIIGGLVVWLRRRDFRQDRPQPGTEDFD